jgi:radical SAM superfamily enzyme YgiQ (UPF0313 family)
MRALLVHPRTPNTYWGFQESLPFIGKQAPLPPLGLATLAAWLPEDWQLRLVDLNIRPLDDADLVWADVALVGGMLVQLESMQEVLSRARNLGVRTVVGGPAATTSPELFEDADIVFQGEAEGRVEELVLALSSEGQGPSVLPPPAGTFPDLGSSRVPRFDLLEVSKYASMSVQYSRGCPFQCEFCDVIEIFGRVPRVKPPEKVLAELEALHDLGYSGSIFFVDDNFIGNLPGVRELLPRLRDWQEAHQRPFELYTEASVNLAAQTALVGQMVEAGFSAVFLGIETPSQEALESVNKRHNLRLDLSLAVDRLTAAGLEVMAGFIVGFDRDTPGIFRAQREFIQSSPIPLAMVGLLNALPGTALWRRLDREGRLRERSCGDQFGRPNFSPVMDEETLLRGYADLLRDLYSPASYYRRCAAYLARVGRRPRASGRGSADVAALLRAVLRIGLTSRRRRHFWALLRRAALGGLHQVREAVVLAVKGEHMIRYTEQQVLPLLRAATSAISAERSTAALLPRATLS